jgi:hypothetical protein
MMAMKGASPSGLKRVARPYQRAADDPQHTKRAVNAWVAACAAALRHSDGGSWALLLESRHLLTLEALRGAGCGVEVATTVVPNPDQLEVAAMLKREPSVLALPLSSHELLAALTAPTVPRTGAATATPPPPPHPARAVLDGGGWPGHFSVVWLDYCGTLGGGGGTGTNRAARQREQDIVLLFEHQLLLGGSVVGGDAAKAAGLLGITFTTRGAGELYRGELLATTLLLVCGLAARHGQRAQALGAVGYTPDQLKSSGAPPGRALDGEQRPSMYTVLFAVSRAARGDGSSDGIVAQPAAADWPVSGAYPSWRCAPF